MASSPFPLHGNRAKLAWGHSQICLHHPVGVLTHMVPFGKFHRIGSAPTETFTYVKYDAPEEVGGDRKCFDSPF